ncbi:hypothetical protein AB0F72_08925 [Actinoplanes sp. NPDC023936]|uniref:hypothetical protein n=1 Tax=Actinoplanes sp. NPDC023936 TaxID=3154910 RepID=UPI0033D7DE71
MRGVSTEAIADAYWLSEDVEDEYGLSRHELLVALWFEASQGQPRFRERWREWAERVGPLLWDTRTLDVDAVELPGVR